MAIFLQIMSYVIHGTLIMSAGDIKGGPWPRDVHESSKLRSGLPTPQWWTALATAPCSWQPPPSQVAQPSEAGSLSSGLLPSAHPLSGPHHLPAGGASPYGGTGSHQKTYGEHHFDWIW